MHGQFRSIMLLSALAGLSNPLPAIAHGFMAEFRVLPNRQVQIEAWYDVTEQPAKDAKVRVYQGEELIFDGRLDEHGRRIFSYGRLESMRIVVDAGAGHRAQLRIPETALFHSADGEGGLPNRTTADRNPSVGIRDVVLGITALLAIAAFLLSWRNSQRLRSMEKPPH